MRRDAASRALAAAARRTVDPLVRRWLMKLAAGESADGSPSHTKKRRAPTARQPAPSR
jgi:hypothetical protein